MMLDWTGGFHESGHNVFDSTSRLHDAADFIDASIVIAEPLDGCMGVPMDGSAATGAAITGTFADGSMTGKIALIRRGACYFTSKTINAQNAGAVAAVIYNDDRAGLVTMSGPDVGIEIPAIFIDGRVGDAINEAVTADPTITFSLHCGTVTRYTEPPLPPGASIVTLTTSHCSPMSMVVPDGLSEGRVGDCMVNVDQRLDPSSSLGGCGGHGADDGYCEVKATSDGYKVRACFHDRCWGETAMVCGEYGDSSSIDQWMDVTCEITDFVPPMDSDWIEYQNFGPSGITQIEGAENSLLSNGWTIDGINDWSSCTGGTPGPICRWCPGGCSNRGIGEYAGFWAGGTATGIMDLPLPDGFDMAEITLGMHYDNPLCQGIVSIGHVGVRPPPL